MNRFIRCLESDPDLHSIEKDDLPLIIQNLFILTGCDYDSFFKDHGKTSFFKTFFKYTEFITTSSVENNVIGKLSLTNSDDISSFLSFIRLIGCEYWRKCSSAFLREKLETPEQLYRTVYSSNLSPKENHIAWISKIREALYSIVPSEEFYLPSFDALFLHWKRSYWVSRVWVQAYCENVQYLSLTDFGWKLEIDGQLDVIWDSPENLQKVINNIKLWTAGCNCLKSDCNSKICGCKKINMACGPGFIVVVPVKIRMLTHRCVIQRKQKKILLRLLPLLIL
ncbi:KIF4 [Mytilus coruscus]|uniref:KIF4 n=1 Tax=Mytilus coruscus TaxID=42192 RepID=A0A6J8EZA9_MYTCO|nr:KIF4 [Mytilus coruscus]